MTEPRFSGADVRAYYDANTRAFVDHGQGGALGVIHRAVWGPGVRTREQAFHYVEDLVAAAIAELPIQGRPPRIADLGCGIGASLTYLAERLPIQGLGVTLSPVQARHGQQRATAFGLGDRIQIAEADYSDVPAATGSIDLAYAIESFVHGASPERFFREAARIVRPGGLLVLCDDVRLDDGSEGARRTLAQFTGGWHVNSLLTPVAWRETAARASFVHLATEDLTPYLELGRPRDRAIRLVAGAFGWAPRLPRVLALRLAPLLGGIALQRAISKGWVAYQFAIFRRVEPTAREADPGLTVLL